MVLHKAVLTVNKMAKCAVREGISRELIFDDSQDEEDSPSNPTESNYYYIVTCILTKLVEILQFSYPYSVRYQQIKIQ